MTGIILLSIVIVGAAMLALAIGAIFSRNSCVRGSCGGLQSSDLETRGLTCGTCPLRKTATGGIDGRRPLPDSRDGPSRLS